MKNMAKEKFNMGNLLPQKPVVLKAPETETVFANSTAALEKAVAVIHRNASPEPESEKTGLAGTKKVSFDLPAEYYRYIKVLCLDRDISMREYLMELIAADYSRRAANG